MKVVVFTGAGASADSGIATFRGGDGLWDNYRVEDICTPEALVYNRKTVVEFYNKRRKEVMEALPNAGHRAIAALERFCEVQVITQNIDDLHERAGSTNVLHLHGEIGKLCTADKRYVYPIEGWKQELDAVSPDDGSLLRPFIVFFGEAVPLFEQAATWVSQADVFIVVGTSLAVYPAASLLHYVGRDVPIYLVDPSVPRLPSISQKIEIIQQTAAKGMPLLLDKLVREFESKE